MAAAKGKAIVVGGGLAGATTVIKIAEAGTQVLLFSVVPARRSHSVCAQGGINASMNLRKEGDSVDIHFKETVKGGEYLQHQPLARGMCYAAPDIVYLLARMGVQFNRTPEGNLDFRGFGGTLFHRTAFAGASTGQQIVYALDEQMRKLEADGLVERYENWEFLSAVIDNGVCKGICAMNLWTGEICTFRADAVVLATGGATKIYGRPTGSEHNTGSPAAAVYMQGAWLGNPEMVQFHPTAIPGKDKCRLISESVRSEGGRVWVPRDGKPWYFLEEKYPKYGNIVPRDIASKEIYHVVKDLHLGVNGEDFVYLDVTHLPPKTLQRIWNVLEIYEMFTGEDPTKVPMRIYPACHYYMGGLWCDYRAKDGMPIPGDPHNHMTNIPGLYAVGEVDYQYHGANRLGANSLLSCIYGGMLCGPAVVSYIKNLKVAGAVNMAPFEDEKKRMQEKINSLLHSSGGSENTYRLMDELGEVMYEHVGIVRFNKKLEKGYEKLLELQERYKKVEMVDTGTYCNKYLVDTYRLGNMLEYAKATCKAALMRDESRGAHYKPDFDFRPSTPNPKDDPVFMKKFMEREAQWGKTTIVKYSPDGPIIEYQDIDRSIIPPEPRKYD